MPYGLLLRWSFPVKVGPLVKYDHDGDVFVAKVNPAGTDLLYCGYIGGPYLDAAYGIAVDSGGNAYITGEGGSGYPLKGGPLSTANGGAIVTKINATGTDLVYSGIIGGNRPSGGSGIAVDAAGNAYVGGTTQCDQYHFPVKVGPDLTFNYGTYDCFVAKVNPQGSALVYCGYIGGGEQ